MQSTAPRRYAARTALLMFVLLVAAVVAAETRPTLPAVTIAQEAPASDGLLLARLGRYAIERYCALRSGL